MKWVEGVSLDCCAAVRACETNGQTTLQIAVLVHTARQTSDHHQHCYASHGHPLNASLPYSIIPQTLTHSLTHSSTGGGMEDGEAADSGHPHHRVDVSR